MTPIPDIIEKHLNLWFADGVSRPGDGKKTLRDYCNDMIDEALSQEGAALAELKSAERDRDGWMRRYMVRGDEIIALKEQLAEMTKARDNAVTAARSIGVELEEARSMLQEAGSDL